MAGALAYSIAVAAVAGAGVSFAVAAEAVSLPIASFFGTKVPGLFASYYSKVSTAAAGWIAEATTVQVVFAGIGVAAATGANGGVIYKVGSYLAGSKSTERSRLTEDRDLDDSPDVSRQVRQGLSRSSTSEFYLKLREVAQRGAHPKKQAQDRQTEAATAPLQVIIARLLFLNPQ